MIFLPDCSFLKTIFRKTMPARGGDQWG